MAHFFREEQFHLGFVLWQAWRNTIYCAMEAYKELFKHKRNEEKTQQNIHCFQTIWTTAEIFGRLGNSGIKWNLTPHLEFLPQDLGAWTAQPIQIHRPSPSPDIEAEFTARQDLPDLVEEFLQGIGRNWQPPQEEPRVNSPNSNSLHTQHMEGDPDTHPSRNIECSTDWEPILREDACGTARE